MQPQELTKEPMVELDTGGNAVDVELKAEKEVQVEEQKDNNAEQAKEVVKEVKKDVARAMTELRAREIAAAEALESNNE